MLFNGNRFRHLTSSVQQVDTDAQETSRASK